MVLRTVLLTREKAAWAWLCGATATVLGRRDMLMLLAQGHLYGYLLWLGSFFTLAVWGAVLMIYRLIDRMRAPKYPIPIS